MLIIDDIVKNYPYEKRLLDLSEIKFIVLNAQPNNTLKRNELAPLIYNVSCRK